MVVVWVKISGSEPFRGGVAGLHRIQMGKTHFKCWIGSARETSMVRVKVKVKVKVRVV